MIAAVKLKKAQARIISLRPYANKMNEMLIRFVNNIESSKNELLQERKINTPLIIIISSDRGLCGSFNANLMKYTTEHISKLNKDFKLLIIGKKAADYFKKRNYNIIESYTNLFSNLDLNISNDITMKLIRGYLDKEYDSVDIIYNEFKSIIKQDVTVEKFIPLVTAQRTNSESFPPQTEYIYEPDSEKILEELIPKQLKIQFWKILLESNAAELGARMSAMELATQNADELLHYLELVYNKARQESITTELLEVVSGAEALR